ncbi:MAG: tRNA lysidine(34) synthetase TilS, partial [Caulobacteraceae bacterium]
MRVSPAIAAPISLLDNPAVSEAFASRLDATSKTPIAVAFSGGGDSLALRVAAKDWACRVRRPVLAFHVDHGLQAASGEWASFAEQVCGELGVRFQKFDWTGPKPATGLPAAARAARHRLIADAAREAGCCAILVGHTADDVLEGDLIRAETPGLGCLTEWSPSPVWPEGRGLFHFRPLLSVRRETLRDYLIAGDWRWIDDPANDDPAYARARARRLLSSPVQRSETGEG